MTLLTPIAATYRQKRRAREVADLRRELVLRSPEVLAVWLKGMTLAVEVAHIQAGARAAAGGDGVLTRQPTTLGDLRIVGGDHGKG